MDQRTHLATQDEIVRLKASNEQLSETNKRLMQLNRQLCKLAITDELTDLFNRRYMDSWMKRYTSRSTTGDDSLSVILLDIDHFKEINDTLGHDAGDSALRDLSGRLQAFGRTSDIVGRYGGEEFIIIMPGTQAEEARCAAERLRRHICEKPFVIDGEVVNLTISLGLASVLPDTIRPLHSTGHRTSERLLITQADKALYVAKDRGRNTCVHYDELRAPAELQSRIGCRRAS